MPRHAKTPADRMTDVRTAAANLSALIDRAVAIGQRDGLTAATTLAAWEAVETNGATVHRQARILAGKSRGG